MNTQSEFHAIRRLSADLKEAREAGDEPLIRLLEPQLEKAEALAEQIATGAPANAALEEEYRQVRAELDAARRLIRAGTRVANEAIERVQRVAVLEARQLVVMRELEDARAAVNAPAAALDRMGRDKDRETALDLTDKLASSLFVEGPESPHDKATRTGGAITPAVVVWLGASERAILHKVQARRAKSRRDEMLFHVTDAEIEHLFALRRRAIEAQHRRLIAQAESAAQRARELADVTA